LNQVIRNRLCLHVSRWHFQSLTIATASSVVPNPLPLQGADSGSGNLTKATKCGMGIPLLAHHTQIDEKLLQIDE
jgi:hypothetical protein